MKRFVFWTAGGIAVGFLFGSILHDSARTHTGGEIVAMALAFAACTIAGAIGGAAHSIIAFLDERDRHESFLRSTREGLKIENRDSN